VSEIPKEILQEVAELIILDHATDIEYSTVREMSYDELDMADLSEVEQENVWHRLDKLIRSAKVTVEFGDA
jgi:hypothetical protein